MTAIRKKDFAASAAAAWGKAAPDWIVALARAASKTGLATAARGTGYSTATISYVLAKKYSGDLTRVERAVRGALMNATVDCPIVGEIGSNRCLAEQAKNFRGSSAVRTQLYNKCRGIGTPRCPHSMLGRDER